MPQARLWCGSVRQLLGDCPSDYRHWLSPTELTRFQGFTARHRRDQFLAGRWQVRRALATLHGGSAQEWQLSAFPDAPPHVAGGPVACFDVIGISHSGDVVACALSTVTCGLDLERHDRRALDLEGLAALVFSDAERECWRAQPVACRQTGFLGWWTLKEAWLKARGRRLDAAAMRSIEALPVGAGPANARLWREANFTLALVGPGPSVPPLIATPTPCSEAQCWWLRES